MANRLPLTALLSQVLVAFTIEFDNEFEHQTPHRTTHHGATAGSLGAPWLVSLPMWTKLLRFIPEDGITVPDFQHAAGLTKKETVMWLTRISQWWGYVAVQRNGTDSLSGVIQPIPEGQKAIEVWRPLTANIEERWRRRFGAHQFDNLREAMRALVSQLNPDLPDGLPILGYHMLSVGPAPERASANRTTSSSVAAYTLPMLLSKLLLALAIQFEQESGLSLAISANILRVAEGQATRVRDLPRLSGISREGIAMAVKRLVEGGFAEVAPESNESKAKALHLTAKGRHARDAYYSLNRDLEERWNRTFGDVVADVRRSLEPLVHESGAASCPLFSGLEPYPDNWRARVPRPGVLPHFPMVLHRGGFPDGS